MKFVEDSVIEILEKRPSECSYIDYKLTPYTKAKNHEFVRDIIAMLNSEEAIGKDKYIVIGIEDSKRELCGIDYNQWRDDNEYQNLLKKITPRPMVQSGTVTYEKLVFGYFFISADNTEWIYEVGETVIGNKEDRIAEKNGAYKGQAFTRMGSRKTILMNEGRKKLLERKVNIEKKELLPLKINLQNPKNIITTISMVGCWNESYTGDKELVAILAGEIYDECILGIRQFYIDNPDRLKHNNQLWRCRNHKQQVLDVTEYIFDDDIEKFFQLARTVFLDVDPKYEYPAKQRFAVNIITAGNIKKYSKNILHGIAETLAIIGNNVDAFCNCSNNIIRRELVNFEKAVFQVADWKIYATIADEMKYLAEACPDIFLKEIQRLLRSKDSAFYKYMSEKEEAIGVTNYGYQIGDALASLAQMENYFSLAMENLFLLSEIRDKFLDTMVIIVLPWFPQTHAGVGSRVGVIKGLANENENLMWKVLMKLMPKATTNSFPVQKNEYMHVEEISEKVSQQDYVDASIGYINIACNLIHSYIDRMLDLLKVVDDVPVELQTKILDILRENSKQLDDEERERLWNGIKDFVLKHRKFHDATWALSEERLACVDKLASDIMPDSKSVEFKRLFKKDQFSLHEEKANYDEEEKKLRKKQIEALNEIYINDGLKQLLVFVRSVENRRVAGICIASFLEESEIAEIVKQSKNIMEDELISGIVITVSIEQLRHIMSSLCDDDKAKLYSKLPLTEKCYAQVQQLSEESQNIFWMNTEIRGIELNSMVFVERIVKKLNNYGRIDKSVFILYNYLFLKKEYLQPQLILQTLNCNVANYILNDIDGYHIQRLIKWLQKQEIPKEEMISIEWKYFDYLNEIDGVSAKYILSELSTDPVFFMSILKLMYGKDNCELDGVEVNQKILQQCYSLLYNWKITPGTIDNGGIDTEMLDKWISTVKSIGEECALLNIAMDYLGKAIFHAPADKDGFFIDRGVAQYLQEDIDGHIRSGYYSESINSRGVHTVDYTGQAEFKIEKEYRKKATLADESGLYRFAETLREIADFYYNEGISNIQEGKEWCDLTN